MPIDEQRSVKTGGGSIASRLAIACAAIVGASILATGAATAWRQDRDNARVFESRCLAAARTAASLIDPARHAKLIGARADVANLPDLAEFGKILRKVALGTGIPPERMQTVRKGADGSWKLVATTPDNTRTSYGDRHASQGGAGDQPLLEIMSRALVSKLPEASILGGEDTTRIVAFAPIVDASGAGVEAIVEASFDPESAAPAWKTLAPMVLGEAVIGMLVAFFLARSIAGKPARAMQNLARDLGNLSSGDLSARIDVGGVGELADVGQSINRFLVRFESVLADVRGLAAVARKEASKIGREAETARAGGISQGRNAEKILSVVATVDTAARRMSSDVEALVTTAHESSSVMLEVEAGASEVSGQVGRMDGLIQETSSSITEMTSAIRSIDENVKSLASSTEDAASSMAELDASAKSIESIANETANLAERATQAAHRGKQAVAMTTDGMSAIADQTRRVTETIAGLERRTREIGEILTVIRGVADQTNLLALNAAIIAAQAGEKGKGFDVVAEEIRELAERTAVSTREIADVIETVQREAREAVDVVGKSAESVQEGRRLAGEAAGALEQILTGTTEATERVGQIARATREQSRTSQNVSVAMERISSMLGQITRSTREQTATAASIERATDTIREVSGATHRSIQDQSRGSAEISRNIATVSERAEVIARAVREQRVELEKTRAIVEEIVVFARSQQAAIDAVAGSAKALQAETAQLEEGIGRFQAE